MTTTTSHLSIDDLVDSLPNGYRWASPEEAERLVELGSHMVQVETAAGVRLAIRGASTPGAVRLTGFRTNVAAW